MHIFPVNDAARSVLQEDHLHSRWAGQVQDSLQDRRHDGADRVSFDSVNEDNVHQAAARAARGGRLSPPGAPPRPFEN